ncbi:MAG: O-antigen ligase family protein [Coriobacteriia bacterium]|nr:O-antigen ligase family protein [Coriobacteriia bacterium]MBN2840849.1 O-antigen ligase family protein [Coriobacteriia bacterium]
MRNIDRPLTEARIEAYPEYKWLALILPAAYLLSPKIEVAGIGFRAGDLVLWAAIFLCLLPVAYERVIRPYVLDMAFVLVGVSMAVSFVAVLVLDPGSIGVRDLFEFPKVFLYWCVYRVGVTMLWDRRDLGRLVRIGVVGSSVVSLIGLLQSMNALAVNEWLTPNYASGHHIYKLMTIGRIVGTFESPNYTGLFLAIMIIAGFLVLAKALFERREGASDSRRLRLTGLWLLLVMTAFMLAASRTSLLALMLVLPVLMVLFVRKRPRGPSRRHARVAVAQATLALVVLAGAGQLIGSNLPKIEGARSLDLVARLDIGLEQAFGDLPDTSSSMYERLLRWSVAFDRWEERPILGWGTAKGTESVADRPPTDNEYLRYMERYGLLGLFAYLLFFYALMREAFVRARSAPLESGLFTPLDLAWLNLGIGGTMLFFNLMAGAYYNLQIFPIVLFLHGFMVSLFWKD